MRLVHCNMSFSSHINPTLGASQIEFVDNVYRCVPRVQAALHEQECLAKEMTLSRIASRALANWHSAQNVTWGIIVKVHAGHVC